MTQRCVLASELAPVEWLTSPEAIGYEIALAIMDARVAAILAGEAAELVWLLEHPPLYTAGTSARPQDLLAPGRFPVHMTGRGGKHTYHGPGQRIAYVMLDARRRAGDVRAFVSLLEAWIIEALHGLGVAAVTRPERVGVWVPRPERGALVEDKIAAVGIRLRRWISLHGVSLNVAPNLEHYSGIVPCGLSEHGVTSLADLGRVVRMEQVDLALALAFAKRIGAVRPIASIPELTMAHEGV